MRTITLVSGAAVVGSAAYLALGRKRILTWGATIEEVTRTMPGDDLLPNPDILTTRAITIDAPPGAIWPWLVQMGPGRGGAYTYDWIENLFGLNMHSADEILPQFQDLKVGDVQQLGSKGPRLRVEVLETEQAMVLRSEDGNWVWAFGLYPEDLRTRLVSRNRISTPAASAVKAIVGVLVMEPGSLVMERKMLLGFRHRAEAIGPNYEAVSASEISQPEGGGPEIRREALMAAMRVGHLVSRWGATDEEATRSLAGDEMVPDPGIASTRAIDIYAPVHVGPGSCRWGGNGRLV